MKKKHAGGATARNEAIAGDTKGVALSHSAVPIKGRERRPAAGRDAIAFSVN